MVGKAKETPVSVKNKEDLGLFVIKTVRVSLRKNKVWCPLGSICKAFSQQTFSHHRQMPSVLQLGVNGFWTANFTAVSNEVDRGGMRDFLQENYLKQCKGACWNSHDEQRKWQYWGLMVQAYRGFCSSVYLMCISNTRILDFWRTVSLDLFPAPGWATAHKQAVELLSVLSTFFIWSIQFHRIA